ncbi:MAG: hypothetical protein AAF138_02510 [Planctomycetota bacterium]
MPFCRSTATCALCALASNALATSALATQLEPEPRSILFYGNSFSQSGPGVDDLVQDLAVAAGHAEPYVFGLFVGGKDLRWHYSNATSIIDSQIPEGQAWDHLVLQGHSLRPTTHPTEGDRDRFRTSALGLFEAMLDHSLEADVTLFETWARAPGHAFYPDIWPEPAAMQAELRAGYAQAAADLRAIGSAEVAPVGSAFEQAGFDPGLYADDLWHARNKGALLIGLTLYGSIYDDPTLADLNPIQLADLAADLGLDPADTAEVLAAAEAAMIPTPAGVLALLGGVLLVTGRRR